MITDYSQFIIDAITSSNSSASYLIGLAIGAILAFLISYIAAKLFWKLVGKGCNLLFQRN